MCSFYRRLVKPAPWKQCSTCTAKLSRREAYWHPCIHAVCDPEAAGHVTRVSSEGCDDGSHSDKATTKVEKVHLEWQQLCCAYNTAGGKIVVLHDVWGQAAPGEMQVRCWQLQQLKVTTAKLLLGSQCPRQLQRSALQCILCQRNNALSHTAEAFQMAEVIVGCSLK